MAIPNEKLARALDALHRVDRNGIVRASDLTRTYRERLQKAAFLQEIIKGWLLVSHPEAPPGSSVSWYASFWTFVSLYLRDRFGDEYCLSAEASAQRLAGSTTIPKQVAVMVQPDVRQFIQLPFDTSLAIFSTVEALPPHREFRDGVWTMGLEAAIVRLPEAFYRNYPQDAEIALRMMPDPRKLLLTCSKAVR